MSLRCQRCRSCLLLGAYLALALATSACLEDRATPAELQAAVEAAVAKDDVLGDASDPTAGQDTGDADGVDGVDAADTGRAKDDASAADVGDGGASDAADTTADDTTAGDTTAGDTTAGDTTAGDTTDAAVADSAADTAAADTTDTAVADTAVTDTTTPACKTAADCAAALPPATLGPCHKAVCSGGTCGVTDETGPACDDGDACTVGDACLVGGCKPGTTAKSCDDGVGCTVDSCAPKLGCVHDKAQAGSGCDDGNACTVGDVCLSSGACVGGAKDCDDGVGCTFDGCAPLGGCTHLPKDGECDDGVGCTSDTCDAKAGCTFKASDSACDDGLACTYGEHCDVKTGCSHTETLFSRTYSNGDWDIARAVALLPDGGFALAGAAINGGSDCELARVDKAGKLLWIKSFGGSDTDACSGVATLPDGGLAMIGYTLSSEVPGGAKNAGAGDMWLVRTDQAGTLLWTKTFGGSKYDRGSSVVILPDGGFALAGGTSSTDLPAGQKSVGSTDFWLVRTDPKGTLLWSQTYGGTGADGADDIALLPSGGFVLAGSADSIDLPAGQKSAGQEDFWLVRTDAAGALVWSKTYGGSGSDGASGVAVLADGGFAVAGRTNSIDLPGGQKCAGNFDFWLVRTNPSGTLLWSKTFGGIGVDVCHGLSVLVDGGFALAGEAETVDLPGGAKSAGKRDFWLVRTDSAGTLLWSRTYGGSHNDASSALAVLDDGGFALAGNAGSSDLPDGQKVVGIYDFWLIRTDPWGNATCAAAGACYGKPPAACDDANACTADLCTAATGCSHANLADGAACATGKACAGGVCK